jgi:hypothetical protein
MSVKTHFSIRDIENLSGVKAHTICVCEKEKYTLWILGQKHNEVQKQNTASNIVCFDSIKFLQKKQKI